MEPEKKKKIPWASLLLSTFGFLLGAACCWVLLPNEEATLYDLVEALTFLGISAFGCTLIHEMGHMIGGKLTRYHFVLFRVGPFSLCRNLDGKFCMKRYGIPGTAGQCLAEPPRGVPFREVDVSWYLLGGGFANLVSAVYAAIFYILFPGEWKYITTFIIITIFFGLTNLIPMKVGGIFNDGYTLLACRRDEQVKIALLTQLTIVGEFSRGKTLDQMPPTWFYPKLSLSERITSNPMIASIWQYTAWRFLISDEYFQAKIIFDALAHNEDLIPLQRFESLHDYLLTMLLEGRVEEVKIYLVPKELERLRKPLSKYFLSYHRYCYAFALLASCNKSKAKEAKAKFEKVCKKYPFQGEITMEEQMMEKIDQTY